MRFIVDRKILIFASGMAGVAYPGGILPMH